MITAGLAGLLIGLPVLRMRGDYLAIVTLGFGEIIRLVALSDQFKPWLGAAMGVTGIPSPTIDLRGLAEAIPILEGLGGPFVREIEMFSANEMYYLVLGAVALVAVVAYRLSQSRQGRAWMAMRADEDVAEAMGINLVKNKLLAFWIGASFSGIGGAVFAAWWHSIFPGSFNLQVSINVLSLIIIGGLGSFSGVVIGAFVLIGLPEVLREFEEFRQLVFGALLVIMMLVRPEGLIPRQPPELEEEAEELAGERPPTLKTNEEAAS
jgi:branched-chain amino acid transport system permease protein